MTSSHQQQLSILLIGETCVDRYQYVNVSRISPEAPVPVAELANCIELPGMAANVKRNLETLNCTVDFITNHEPIEKIRFVDVKSGQHMLRVDSSDTVTNNWAAPNLRRYDAIVVSDYDKGFISPAQLDHLRRTSVCPIYVDTKKRDLACVSGCYVKINELERSLSDISQLHDAELITTLGSKGAEWRGRIFSPPPTEVVDVCGCGDTFLAAFCVKHLTTNSIEAAIHYGNAAASITVSHRRTYAPTHAEIIRKL